MTGFPWGTNSTRPELQKNAKGLYPGEAERGIPDFLRRRVVITDVNDGPSLYEVIAERVSPATNLQATTQLAPLPWAAKS